MVAAAIEMSDRALAIYLAGKHRVDLATAEVSTKLAVCSKHVTEHMLVHVVRVQAHLAAVEVEVAAAQEAVGALAEAVCEKVGVAVKGCADATSALVVKAVDAVGRAAGEKAEQVGTLCKATSDGIVHAAVATGGATHRCGQAIGERAVAAADAGTRAVKAIPVAAGQCLSSGLRNMADSLNRCIPEPDDAEYEVSSSGRAVRGSAGRRSARQGARR